jgi:uncharacterized protein
MRTISFLIVWMLSSTAIADERKAVFDLTTGDSERIETRIISSIKALSKHYEKQGDQLKAVVVISGKAYKYFIEDLANSPYRDDEAVARVQNTLKAGFKELHEQYGVRFDMCGQGMKMRNIKKESVYPFVNTDKSKYVYLIDWQNEGYAYIPI